MVGKGGLGGEVVFDPPPPVVWLGAPEGLMDPPLRVGELVCVDLAKWGEIEGEPGVELPCAREGVALFVEAPLSSPPSGEAETPEGELVGEPASLPAPPPASPPGDTEGDFVLEGLRVLLTERDEEGETREEEETDLEVEGEGVLCEEGLIPTEGDSV